MDYKKLCELIEVRNRQLELFKVAKKTEFPELVRRELEFLETELKRIILELADEIESRPRKKYFL